MFFNPASHVMHCNQRLERVFSDISHFSTNFWSLLFLAYKQNRHAERDSCRGNFCIHTVLTITTLYLWVFIQEKTIWVLDGTEWVVFWWGRSGFHAIYCTSTMCFSISLKYLHTFNFMLVKWP